MIDLAELNKITIANRAGQLAEEFLKPNALRDALIKAYPPKPVSIWKRMRCRLAAALYWCASKLDD